MSEAISVVVCAHDEERWRDLQAAVRSLEQQTLQPDGVVVVVDRNPQLASRARQEFTTAVVVENTGTPGLGGARNTERPSWFPPEFDWVVGCSYSGMPETPKDVRNMFGCNMSFRRELVRELGGFRLGYGCDETELCIRLRQRWPEKRVLYLPEARVFHRVPASRTRFRRFISRCYFEGGSKAVVSIEKAARRRGWSGPLRPDRADQVQSPGP
jgi:GT2 family glycosyltransferase